MEMIEHYPGLLLYRGGYAKPQPNLPLGKGKASIIPPPDKGEARRGG